MHGNVFEWCADWFGDDYYEKSPVNDPTGPEEPNNAICRGGSWGGEAAYCRSAYRSHSALQLRRPHIGFRLSMTIDLERVERKRADVARATAEYIAAPDSAEAWPPSASLLALRRDQISPAALAMAGDGDPQNAPASLVAVLGLPEPIHTDGVNALAFSADGRWLASGGADKTVLLWEVETMRVRRALHGHEGVVTSVALTPDGQTNVSGSDDGTVKLWSFDDQDQTTLKPELGRGVQIAVSPDGRFLAAGGDNGVIKLWNWSRWQEPATLPSDYSGAVSALAFTPDGETLACGYGIRSPGKPIVLYKMPDGTVKQELPNGNGAVHSLAFSRDGKHLASTGPQDPKVESKTRLWSLESGEAVELDGAAYCVTISPDGESVAIGGMSSAHIIDVASDKRRDSTNSLGTYARATSLAFSPDGKTLVVGDEGGAVNFYQTSDWQPKADFLKPGHRSAVTHVAICADSRTVLSTGLDKTLRAWDVSSAGTHRLIRSSAEQLRSLTTSPDGKTFATGPSPMIVWDAATFQERFTTDSMVQIFAFSPDGQTLAEETWGLDCVRLWDVRISKEVHRFPVEQGQGVMHLNPGGLTFTPDGKRLVIAGAQGKVVVWDAITAEELVTWNDKPIRSATIAPDGSFLATGHTDGTIQIHDTETGELTAGFQAHAGGVYVLRFTPDGKSLLSSGVDGLIQVRDVTTPRPHVVIPVGPAGYPVTFDVDRSGQYLLASGATPLIYVHRLPQLP